MTSKPVASPYYPALDGFRAVAVLLVFSTHYLSQALPGFRNWGFLGVDLFFVLSGFLITGILFDSRRKPHCLRDFYARRILRIFPLYYGFWLAALLLWPVFHWQWNRDWLLWPMHLGNFARFIFFVPGDVAHLDVLHSGSGSPAPVDIYMGHFWSLCVEEQFYLVWPFVVLLARSRRTLIWISASVIVLEPFVRLILFHVLPQTMLRAELIPRLTLTRLDALLVGGLLALLLRGPEAEWLHRHGRALTVLSISIFGVMWVEYAHRNKSYAVQLTDPVLTTFGFTIIALAAGGVILELIRAGSPAARLATWRPLRQLGQVSYGFYVFHDLPHGLYRRLVEHFVSRQVYTLTAALAFVCTCALSLLSYRFLESPFLALKGRFSGQVHRAPVA